MLSCLHDPTLQRSNTLGHTSLLLMVWHSSAGSRTSFQDPTTRRNLYYISPSAMWSPTSTFKAPPRLLRYVYPAQRDPPCQKSLLAGPHRVAGYERRCCTRLRNSLGAHSAHALLLQSSQSKTQDGLSTPSVKVSDWRSCTIWNCVSWPCTQTPPFPHFVTRLHRQPNST